MLADVAVITAIYDDYDVLKPVVPQDGVTVDWVLVTDKEPTDSLGWRVVVEPHPDMTPVRAAKRSKFQPWRYTEAPASIWVDAAFRVTSPRLAVDVMAYALPIAQFVHPWRDCIYAEAEEVIRLGMDPDRDAARQAERYRAERHPEHWGLWASGLIARLHSGAVKQFGRRWEREVEAGSYRDQVSQAYALAQSGLRPASLPGNHLTNAWVRHEPSGRHR